MDTGASRRQFLAAGGVGLLSLLGLGGPRSALGAVSIRPESTRASVKAPDHVLVSIFLRGGADALSVVAPYADDSYYRLRPTIALASPKSGAASDGERLRDLNGFFGLHPALSPLIGLYESGQLAFVHACGSGDETRSHFEAMATMERGLYREDGPPSGWLARHLDTAPWENHTPLRAVALGCLIPDSLVGAPNATAVERVQDLRLISSFLGGDTAIRRHLERLYGDDPHFSPLRPSSWGNRNGRVASGSLADSTELQAAGAEALAVLQKIEALSPETYRPSLGAVYPTDDLGNGLRQTALLIKSGLGMEVACLDHGGFDTHVTQGGAKGALADRLTSLAKGLAAFVADLGPERWRKVTVVVLSEFGRRIEENSGAGTDHGHGGIMMVLGGHGIAGGRVHGQWPGLSELDGPGDLRVTTDYRNVFGEILSRRVGNEALAQIFPGLDYRPVGVVNGA
jgi:uncharacterized protein (DUF1501 family)